jgi:hypothetical protein
MFSGGKVSARKEPGFCAGLTKLFECVRDLDQLWFAPRLAKKRDAYWQPRDEACRHGDVWITGDRRRRGAAAVYAITSDPVGYPGWPCRRRNNCVELVLSD